MSALILFHSFDICLVFVCHLSANKCRWWKPNVLTPLMNDCTTFPFIFFLTLSLSLSFYFASNLADWHQRRSNIRSVSSQMSASTLKRVGVSIAFDNILQPKCIDDWPEIWKMCVIHTFGNLLSFQRHACFQFIDDLLLVARLPLTLSLCKYIYTYIYAHSRMKYD